MFENIEKLEVGEIVQIKSGLFFIGDSSKAICRNVAMVNPSLFAKKAFETLGGELKYESPGNMISNIRKNIAPERAFEEIFIGFLKGGDADEVEKKKKRREIFGVTSKNPMTEMITVRRIGFNNPKEVEKSYKLSLEEEDMPEEVPYWQYYALGEEWQGTAITRGEHELKLTDRGVAVAVFKAVFLKQK